MQAQQQGIYNYSKQQQIKQNETGLTLGTGKHNNSSSSSSIRSILLSTHYDEVILMPLWMICTLLLEQEC